MGFYVTEEHLEDVPRAEARGNENPHRGPNRRVESGYRFYSPEMGRWPNRDPIGGIYSSDIYLFNNNSPVSYCDFLGLVKVTDEIIKTPLIRYHEIGGADPTPSTLSCVCRCEEYKMNCKMDIRVIIHIMPGLPDDDLLNHYGVGYSTTESHEREHAKNMILAIKEYVPIYEMYENADYSSLEQCEEYAGEAESLFPGQVADVMRREYLGEKKEQGIIVNPY